MEPPAPRASKPVVLIAVVLTAALYTLCLIGYRRLTRPAPSVACACAPDEGASGPPAREARSESLSWALASIATCKPDAPQAVAAPEPGARPPDVTPKPEPPEDPMSKEEILARQRADAFTLDAQMRSEEVDPVWAPKLERATTEFLSKVGKTMHLQEVTCRETLCRVKITQLDPKAREQDLDRILTMPVITGQAIALTPNNEQDTVLYFSRKGTLLSVLQPPVRMPPLPSLDPDETPDHPLEP